MTKLCSFSWVRFPNISSKGQIPVQQFGRVFWGVWGFFNTLENETVSRKRTFKTILDYANAFRTVLSFLLQTTQLLQLSISGDSLP